MKHIISVFIILLLIGLGHSTFMRNFTWKNEKTLWIDAVKKAPDQFRPHHNLGRYYQDHGHQEEAISEYKKALSRSVLHRKNETAVTYYNLGNIYGDLRDYEKARYFYERAKDIDPYYIPVYVNIAAVLDREGKYALAHDYLIKAIRFRPDSIEANYNLGFHYLREGQPEKAIPHLQRLSDNKQFGDRALFYLGIAFKQKDQLGRAVTYFKMAMEKNPRNIKLYLHLAEIFYRIGDNKQAKQEVAKAINLMRDKDIFQKILDDLLKKGRSRNLQPRGDIVIPLMSEACFRKSETLKEWSELLYQKDLWLEGKNTK